MWFIYHDMNSNYHIITYSEFRKKALNRAIFWKHPVFDLSPTCCQVRFHTIYLEKSASWHLIAGAERPKTPQSGKNRRKTVKKQPIIMGKWYPSGKIFFCCWRHWTLFSRYVLHIHTFMYTIEGMWIENNFTFLLNIINIGLYFSFFRTLLADSGSFSTCILFLEV